MFSCWTRFFRKRAIENEDISDPCQPNLQNMPIAVMEEVLKNLDAKSTFRLRKVCRNLRFTIDGIEPKLHVNSLSFEPPITKKSMESYMKGMSRSDRRFTMGWLKPRTGCELEWDIQGVPMFSNISMEDADTLLKNTKIILDQLKIDYYFEPSYTSGNMDRDGKKMNFHETMKSLFENRGQLLETKDVVLKVQNLSEATEFLKCIDSKSLKSISIQYGKYHEMDFSELEVLEQWKNADVLKIKGNNVSSFIETFASFKSVSIEDYGITIEKFIEVKELFIRSPKMETFIIESFPFERMKDQLISYFNQELGNPVYHHHHIDFGTEQMTYTWLKDVPDSTEQLQIFLKIDRNNHIKLSKIRL